MEQEKVARKVKKVTGYYITEPKKKTEKENNKEIA